jgi:hypothetical protein
VLCFFLIPFLFTFVNLSWLFPYVAFHISIYLLVYQGAVYGFAVQVLLHLWIFMTWVKFSLR